jgi:integrase
MVSISFVLKDRKASKETPVICYVRYSNQTLKHSTGERIQPKHWNDNKSSNKYQRAKGTLVGSPEFNARLDKVETSVKDVFRRFLNENDNKLPTTETLKRLLEAAFGKTEQSARTFMSFFNEIIESTRDHKRTNPKTGKPISANTLKTYTTTFKHLTTFEQERKRNINFNDIDMDFYDQYKAFLIDKRALKPNTLGKHFQIIKLVMNEAFERGLTTVRLSRRFVTIRQNVDHIFLNAEELKLLETLDISHSVKLERVRDLFLVGCFTGLRYSDFSKLSVQNINAENMFEIKQQKTGDPVIVPVHAVVKRIIDKYNGSLPKAMCNQKMNKYIKEAASFVPELNALVSVPLLKNGTTVYIQKKKYELITTHTARRSFATNLIAAGIPAFIVMAVTGHKTEKAFNRYIKLTNSDKAKSLQQIWLQTRQQLKAV